MLSVSFTDAPMDGREIVWLLERKHQYWDQFRDTNAIYSLASSSRYGVIYEDDEPMMHLFEMPGEPGVLHVLAVKERNRADQRVDELSSISRQLAERWAGFRRVEAKVALPFVQTHRILRRMGFVQETSQKGLRAFYTTGDAPVNVHVFSMIPSEVINKHEDAKMTAEEVGHG